MNTLKLRSLLFSIIFFSGILHCLSGTRLISGDLGQCLSEGTIEVSLNWENTIYEKSGLLIDFLSIAERDPDWETKSLKYFIQQIWAHKRKVQC